jgi:anti-anti-sigma factor
MTAASTIQYIDEPERVVIRVYGHFGFALYRQIREAYQQGGTGKPYVFDLAAAEYIDSSALGMLLLLREQLGGEQAQIEIRHCNPAVRKIFAIANFDKIFRIQ